MRGRTYIDPQGLAAGLELVRDGDVVPEETIPRHLLADDSRENGTRVKADPHLQKRFG